MSNTRVTGDPCFINKPAHAVFELFSDFSRLAEQLPEEHKNKVTLTEDTLLAEAQGMQLGVKVTERQEPSLVVMEQYGNVPFSFRLQVHIRPKEEGCELQLDLDAQLNMMMKMMLGGKLKEFVNQFTSKLAEGLNK
ncbi:MAG: SRPBCC family protein [Bacteroidales bacterium]|jgi:carbon monoxide dehydrogenase subunit G